MDVVPPSFLNDSPANSSPMDKALPLLPPPSTPRFTRSRNLTPKVTRKWEFSPGKKRTERESREQEEMEKGSPDNRKKKKR